MIGYMELDMPFLSLYECEKGQVTTKKNKRMSDAWGLAHQVVSIESW